MRKSRITAMVVMTCMAMMLLTGCNSGMDITKTEPSENETVTTVEPVEDGIYTVDVSISGGSGKAKVESPAVMTVKDGKMTLTLVWGSPNYDYMVVDGEKYLPVNTEGNAVFEIPVSGFDYNIPVSADTTAMSTPHEIEYTLMLDSASVKSGE